MKQLGLFLFVMASMLVTVNAHAVTVQTPGIVMVEADANGMDDGDTTVTVNLTATLYDFDGGFWAFGEMDNGSFVQFTSADDTDSSLPGIQITRNGGEIIDFAIQGLNSSGIETTLFLSDGLGHSVIFSESEYLENPAQLIPGSVSDWYDGAQIQWAGDDAPDIAVTLLGTLTEGNDIDGMSAVPIPAAAFLFCSSLIGIVGIRKKISK